MKDFVNKNKSKILAFIFVSGIVGSIILIVLNISIIDRLQIEYRNKIRENDLNSISQGLEKFIKETNNCPRTNNPVPRTFLPELIFDESEGPRGGVSLSTLEEVESYIDIHKKDPKGTPYLIGVSRDLIIIYTLDYEVIGSRTKTYFVTLNTSLCNQITE